MKGLGDRHWDVPAHSRHPQSALGTAKEAQGHSWFATEGKQLPKAMAFFFPILSACTKLQEVLQSLAAQALHGCDPTPLANTGGREQASTLGSTSASSTHPNTCAFPCHTTI